MSRARSADRKASGKSGLQLEPHQVILKPLVTEKGMFQSEAFNQYSFKVNPAATKTDIKSAIEKLFDVKVAEVKTQVRRGKPRRFKFTYGKTKSWKKAIVKLKGDDKIDFF